MNERSFIDRYNEEANLILDYQFMAGQLLDQISSERRSGRDTSELQNAYESIISKSNTLSTSLRHVQKTLFDAGISMNTIFTRRSNFTPEPQNNIFYKEESK